MDLLTDIFLISVCITPILLVIQLITKIRWYKKFYAVIISRQEAKKIDIE